MRDAATQLDFHELVVFDLFLLLLRQELFLIDYFDHRRLRGPFCNHQRNEPSSACFEMLARSVAAVGGCANRGAQRVLHGAGYAMLSSILIQIVTFRQVPWRWG